jgi:glycosyltransferase involved in cell wall biosynthesis
MWHSFDGSNVCNEPEPYKCERCKGYDKDGIPVMPAGEIKRQKEYLQHIGLPKMDRIVANSDYTAENFEKQFGIKPEVENPVPPPLAYYQKRKVFGYFGGFYPVKGVFVLLDAWARTTGGTLLMFCNAPNDMYEKGAIDGRVLSGYDTVLFMGSYRRSNMPHLLSLVDCVICPSINESFGLVSREVELLGVPCIKTSTGGQIGTVPPNNAAALAVAIQEVIDA